MNGFKVSSDAIDERGFFDPRYTCDIDNSSPELRWKDAPDGTQGYVVVIEALAQPDSGIAMVDSRERTIPLNAPNRFPHWLVYNVPASVLHLPAGIPPQDVLPNGIRQGLNGLNKLGYTGPCPPRGQQLRTYAIRVYALSEFQELTPRLNYQSLWEQIQPHIIGTAEILGRYRRVPQAALERERERAG